MSNFLLYGIFGDSFLLIYSIYMFRESNEEARFYRQNEEGMVHYSEVSNT